jgi:hypothetical protein
MATAISRTSRALAMDHSSWAAVAALPRRPAAAGRHIVRHHVALPRQTRRRSRGDAERHARAPRPDRRVLPLMLQALGRSDAADTPERVLAWLSRSREPPSGPRRHLCISAPEGLGRHGRSLTSRRRRTVRSWGTPRRPSNGSDVWSVFGPDIGSGV